MNRYPPCRHSTCAGSPSTASVSSAAAMNGRLKFDIAMFSAHENWRRAPPDARSVDANSYVLSGSITTTLAPGARRFTKYATAEPTMAPPTMATSQVVPGSAEGGDTEGKLFIDGRSG